MTITTHFYTFLHGRHVGTDTFGNRYFTEKGSKQKAKRWVLYKGKAEPSKVPAEWHGWLHYTHDAPVSTPKYFWRKMHLPNLTGTISAYVPPGHLLRGAHREPTTSDYEAWKP